MKLTLALVLGLTGRAMAGDMSQFTASGGSISESSITVTSFGPNRIVTTGAGGVLVTYSTFSLTGAGNVGIGTATPQWPLTTAAPVSGVTSEGVATVTNPTLGMFWNQGGNASLVVRGSSETAGAAASASVILESNSGVQSTNFLMRTSSGTQSARALINSADRLLGTVGWNTWTSGTTYSQVGSIKTFTEGVPASASNIPTYVTFNTASTATISATEKMRLTAAGDLGIGSTSPNAKLHVVNATSSQTIVSGFDCNGVAGTGNACVQYGGTTINSGYTEYNDSGNTTMTEGNGYNSNSSIYQITTKKLGGTPINALQVRGDGAVSISTTIAGGFEIFYCLGGTFAGNLCRGAACICTGGTATATGVFIK